LPEKVIEVQDEVKAAQGEVCDMVEDEDKKQMCRIVLEKHSNMEISTKKTEEQLSDLTGEDVKLVEEPDWKLLERIGTNLSAGDSRIHDLRNGR
jgi:short-subunit dehydrogenase involved in D-alanine esterification of teichoic acids